MKIAGLSGQIIKDSEILRKELIIPENICRGILPTTVGFGTPPSDLANATDGNFASATGTGTTVLGAAGNLGIINITLPKQYNVLLVGAKIASWTSAGNLYAYLYEDNDGESGTQVHLTTSTTEKTQTILSKLLYGVDVISLKFYASTAATANCRIYEITAYEVGI